MKGDAIERSCRHHKTHKWSRLRSTAAVLEDAAKLKTSRIFIIVWRDQGWLSVVTKIRAGRLGFYCRQGQGFFLLATASRPALGPTQSPIQWLRCVKKPGREFKNAWSYTSIPPYVFMALCLVKQRDNFYVCLSRLHYQGCFHTAHGW
jgi:hypothetical protein